MKPELDMLECSYLLLPAALSWGYHLFFSGTIFGQVHHWIVKSHKLPSCFSLSNMSSIGLINSGDLPGTTVGLGVGNAHPGKGHVAPRSREPKRGGCSATAGWEPKRWQKEKSVLEGCPMQDLSTFCCWNMKCISTYEDSIGFAKKTAETNSRK